MRCFVVHDLYVVQFPESIEVLFVQRSNNQHTPAHTTLVHGDEHSTESDFASGIPQQVLKFRIRVAWAGVVHHRTLQDSERSSVKLVEHLIVCAHDNGVRMAEHMLPHPILRKLVFYIGSSAAPKGGQRNHGDFRSLAADQPNTQTIQQSSNASLTFHR
jgi:hypothetical protein